jgi:hypothetical protein
VAADGHRNAFANAGSYHISNAGPPQIMKRARRYDQDALLALDDFRYRFAVSFGFTTPAALQADAHAFRESPTGSHRRDERRICMPCGPSECRALSRPTALDDVSQFVFEGQLVRPAVLHMFPASDDNARVAVDVGPGQRIDLPLSPSTQVREPREVFQVLRQSFEYGVEFVPLKETLTDIVLPVFRCAVLAQFHRASLPSERPALAVTFPC